MASTAQRYKPDQRRPIQNKARHRPLKAIKSLSPQAEAKCFYGCIGGDVYDAIHGPPHFSPEMRIESLLDLDLHPTDLICDVGGGTGFMTEGCVLAGVPAKNIVLLDQSPTQLAAARRKKAIRGCTIVEGDAEKLPFATDSKDKYVSAGSIEYWPHPAQGIAEAYRVIKPGGKACIIGPSYPERKISRLLADSWMLFPTEGEYKAWFESAGFTDIKIKKIIPSWFGGDRSYGLIIGFAVTAMKPLEGPSESPYKLPLAEAEKAKKASLNVFRGALGFTASFYWTMLPGMLYLGHLLSKGPAKKEASVPAQPQPPAAPATPAFVITAGSAVPYTPSPVAPPAAEEVPPPAHPAPPAAAAAATARAATFVVGTESVTAVEHTPTAEPGAAKPSKASTWIIRAQGGAPPASKATQAGGDVKIVTTPIEGTKHLAEGPADAEAATHESAPAPVTPTTVAGTEIKAA